MTLNILMYWTCTNMFKQPQATVPFGCLNHVTSSANGTGNSGSSGCQEQNYIYIYILSWKYSLPVSTSCSQSCEMSCGIIVCISMYCHDYFKYILINFVKYMYSKMAFIGTVTIGLSKFHYTDTVFMLILQQCCCKVTFASLCIV